jgi:hypothetical protein
MGGQCKVGTQCVDCVGEVAALGNVCASYFARLLIKLAPVTGAYAFPHFHKRIARVTPLAIRQISRRRRNNRF